MMNIALTFGEKINDWTLIKSEGERHWVCRCTCGVEKKVDKYSLKNLSSKRCRTCSSKKMKRSKFAKDISGETYHDWTVLSRAGGEFDEPFWNCRCKCGLEKPVSGSALRKGRSKSCKHCSSKGQRDTKNNLQGKGFGKWKVRYRSKNKNGRIYWNCVCGCGMDHDVSAQTLLEGRSLCCIKCSERKGNHTHGLTRGGKPKLYLVWRSIKERCLNSNCKGFKNYGGRGIRICDRWKNSFRNFYLDVGEKPFEGASIDRIDNEGHYEPNNIRWATRAQQSSNTRRQKYGICVTQWSRENNLDRHHVARHLKDGLPLTEIKKLVKKIYKNH